MTTFYKMLWLELKLTAREPLTVFFTLAFPLLLLLVFGSIFGNEPNPQFGGLGMVDISVPAYIGVIIGTTGLLTLPITLAVYREQGILRRLQLTPLHPLAVLAVQVVVNVLLAGLGALLLVLVGWLFYALQLPQDGLGVLGAFGLSAVSFCVVSFVVASLVPNPRAAQAVGMAILFPMMFLSGAALPREMLPASIQQFSNLLPLSHVILTLRALWFQGSWNISSTLVLSGLLIVGLLLSIRFFRWE